MIRGSTCKALLSTLVVAAMAIAAMPVQAGSTGNGVPKAFQSEASAQQSCPKDVVVWASKDSVMRSFYMKGSPSYAKVNGYYACRKDAEFHHFNAH